MSIASHQPRQRFPKMLRRIYYAVCALILFYYCLYNSYGLYLATATRSIGFTVDTMYLDWNTSFPAVTVCEIFNSEKIWELSELHNGIERDTRIDDLLADVAFFNGNCNSCQLCGAGGDASVGEGGRKRADDEDADDIDDGGDDGDGENVDVDVDEVDYGDRNAGDSAYIECPTNFTNIVEKYRTKCTAMLFNCTWNDRPLECCDAFRPLATEFGVCFTINSMHTSPPYGVQPLIANRQFGAGRLRFSAQEDVTVQLHAPHDVPYTVDGDIKETVLYGSVKDIVISLIEMTNEPSLFDGGAMSLVRRRCRFRWEQANDGVDVLFAHYSHSTCTLECSRLAQLRRCNCTHHLMPRHRHDGNATCDVAGLMCLTENFGLLGEARKNCDCLPSCEEPEYNSIYTSDERYREDASSIVTISLIDLPKQRHRRILAKSQLDLMLSIGGLCGLFTGVSLVSLIETVLQATVWSKQHVMQMVGRHK